MRPVRRFYVGSHPCQGYRKTSYNGWDGGLLSTGSLKFRELEPDEANGEDDKRYKINVSVRPALASTSLPYQEGIGHGDAVWSTSDTGQLKDVNPLSCSLYAALRVLTGARRVAETWESGLQWGI